MSKQKCFPVRIYIEGKNGKMGHSKDVCMTPDQIVKHNEKQRLKSDIDGIKSRISWQTDKREIVYLGRDLERLEKKLKEFK